MNILSDMVLNVFYKSMNHILGGQLLQKLQLKHLRKIILQEVTLEMVEQNSVWAPV